MSKSVKVGIKDHKDRMVKERPTPRVSSNGVFYFDSKELVRSAAFKDSLSKAKRAVKKAG